MTAEKIVVATGGHPERPKIPGAALGIVSDDAFYLKERPRRVAIIGGGYIGVEFAGIFAGLGAQTHLIYRQPLPLRGFDEDLRIGLAEELANNGVILHPDTVPNSVKEIDGAKHLALSDLTVLEVDLVFFATGRVPNVAGLGLDKAGIAVGKNGAITVDEALQTSVPHIYAIGDVTDRLNLTPVATAEGHAVADTLFGGRKRTVSLKNVPTAVVFHPADRDCGPDRKRSRRPGRGGRQNLPHPLHPDAAPDHRTAAQNHHETGGRCGDGQSDRGAYAGGGCRGNHAGPGHRHRRRGDEGGF